MPTSLRSLLSVFAWLGLFMGTIPACAQAAEVEELLPANSVLYLRIDGALDHQKTFEETAAYRALYESGLMEVVQNLLDSLSATEQGSQLPMIFNHLRDHGFSLAVAVDAPNPGPFGAWGTIVVPAAGEGVELLADAISEQPNLKGQVQETLVAGRTIKYIETGNPLVDAGWWAEGDQLVIAFGMNSIASAMAVADGKRENITKHPLWDEYKETDSEFDVTQFAWLDLEALREMFAEMPLPPVPGAEGEPRKVQDLLVVLGLDSLNNVVALSGYRGESLWSETIVDAPGDRHGLLALYDQHLLTLEELPAMPVDHLGIFVASFDWGKAYDILLGVAVELAEFGPPQYGEQIDQALARVKQELGFELSDLFASMGNINCVYSDSSQGAFGLGSVALISVKDAPQLKACVEKLLTLGTEAVEKEQAGVVRWKKMKKGDRQLFRIEMPKAPFFAPTISIDEDWMIIGLLPQAVQAQHLRLDGVTFSWSIADDLGDALELFPEEFTSLQVVDPVGTYKTLVSYAPVILSLIELGMRESGQVDRDWKMPLDVSEIPPAELVIEPLFLNVTMSTVDRDGLQVYTRQSLPGLPLMGGSGAGGVTSTAVLISLLLPAVQQAREAARRAQERRDQQN